MFMLSGRCMMMSRKQMTCTAREGHCLHVNKRTHNQQGNNPV
jgi:hypothetical protein